MCRSMADIQSATAENRRKKEEETTEVKYNVRICYAGRPQNERKYMFTEQK